MASTTSTSIFSQQSPPHPLKKKGRPPKVNNNANGKGPPPKRPSPPRPPPPPIRAPDPDYLGKSRQFYKILRVVNDLWIFFADVEGEETGSSTDSEGSS